MPVTQDGIPQWNYNTNSNNMYEYPFVIYTTRLAGGLLLKMLKYFELMLNIFEFSRVWENVESWFINVDKLFWIAQSYFSTDIT